MKWIKTVVTLLFTIFWLSSSTSCSNHKKEEQIKHFNKKMFNDKSEFSYLNDSIDVNYLVSILDNSNDIEAASIGLEGRKSETYAISEKLSAIASDTTLVRLTKHKSPKIRVYSMWALIEKNKQLASTQIKRLKQDQATVVYKSGCIIDTTKVCWLLGAKFDKK